MAKTIIHNAGQLVTCASDGRPKRGGEMTDVGIINDGAVVFEDGVITAVGTSEQILREHAPDETIDADGKAVCPGFVDPHTHIVFAGDRLNEFELKIKGAEYLDILAAGGGIISTVKNTRQASFDELLEQSRKRLDKMLSCGTTACEIKTGYGLDTATELKMLRVIEELDRTHVVDIVPTFLAAHTIAPEYKEDPDGYVDLICDEMLPKAWEWYESSHFFRPSDSLQASRLRSGQKNVPFYADVFCERNAFDLEQMQRILQAAAELGFKLKAHVDQFTNLGGSRLGIGLKAASIDHLDVISDEEIEMLANSGTVGIVIPTENFNGAKTTFANARKMIDGGCALALSTDYNPGSAPCPSMPMAMAIACRYQKLLPSEALNAATINAAYAVGLGEMRGSIEAGKSADFLILETHDYRLAAYEFGGNVINQVIINGKYVI